MCTNRTVSAIGSIAASLQRVEPNESAGIDLAVLGIPLSLSIRERSRRVLRELTAAEQEGRRRGWMVNPYDLVPSSEITIEIGARWRTMRSSDGIRAQLEDRLNDMTAG